MNIDDQEFTVLQLFKLSQKLNMLQYKLLFDIFNPDTTQGNKLKPIQGYGNPNTAGVLDIEEELDDDLLEEY